MMISVLVHELLGKVALLALGLLLSCPVDCRLPFRFRAAPTSSSLSPPPMNPLYPDASFRFADKRSSPDQNSAFRFVDKKSADTSFRLVDKKSSNYASPFRFADDQTSPFRLVKKESWPESPFRYADQLKSDTLEPFRFVNKKSSIPTSPSFRLVDKRGDLEEENIEEAGNDPSEISKWNDHGWISSSSKRGYIDLQCRGMYDPGIFAQLDNICEDCYNLYRATEVHNLCRAGCFRSQTFRHCLQSLLLDKESEFYQELVEIIG